MTPQCLFAIHVYNPSIIMLVYNHCKWQMNSML